MRATLLIAAALPFFAVAASRGAPPGLVLAEFVFDKAPFRECHASTIVATSSGLLAAWFGGTEEGSRDVGIWLSRHDGKAWSAPVEVANGVEADGRRYPCWNPVLFQLRDGPLVLWYKVGPSPSRWWGVKRTSADAGKTWSDAERVPDGLIGPVKNKPVQLGENVVLAGSSTEHDGWQVHMERSTDGGRSWRRVGVDNQASNFTPIQPTILPWSNDKIQILCRSRQGKVVESWSEDGGQTWSALAATTLPNPNAGLDAVRLADGRALLVYNHTTRGSLSRPRDREMLNVAVSRDGKTWQAALVLENEPGEFSYPAVVQTADGLVHVAYTHQRRRIKHVVIDPARLELRDFVAGRWPAAP